jgi:hypothetical protein
MGRLLLDFQSIHKRLYFHRSTRVHLSVCMDIALIRSAMGCLLLDFRIHLALCMVECTPRRKASSPLASNPSPVFDLRGEAAAFKVVLETGGKKYTLETESFGDIINALQISVAAHTCRPRGSLPRDSECESENAHRRSGRMLPAGGSDSESRRTD